MIWIVKEIRHEIYEILFIPENKLPNNIIIEYAISIQL